VTASDPTLPGPTDDATFMKRAIDEGRKGHPSPNPHVGAAVVRDGQVVGVGFHEQAGMAHAEVAALEKAGELARGGTLYVTLEPCNHTGRTGPCTQAILAAGITRVVIGCRDPNPHVDGGGLEVLRSAGVVVETGVLEAEARRLVAPWAKYVTTGLPHVSLKLALSLDGRIASRTGTSKWITGPLARAKVHALRSRHDVVGVGIGTALADDPKLTVRDAPGQDPVRLVFDTNLRISDGLGLVQHAREVPTWIICGEEASEERRLALVDQGVEVFRVATSAEGRIDVTEALRQLASLGVVTLMVEGGAELAGSLLAARLVDEAHVFVAPLLLGPRGRPGAVDWAGPGSPQEAPRISPPIWELCGNDAYIHGPLIYP